MDAQIGQANANLALARNLLEIVYVLLKERQRYRETDPKQMRELDKANLVRHHAKRLRQLGADNDVVNELVARLSQPAVSSSVEENEHHNRGAAAADLVCPAKVCRGALAFRARQTRKHEYYVGKHGADETTSPKPGKAKQEKKPETNDKS